jgi:chemotaxis protein CheX
MNIDAAILADPSKRGSLILEILNYYVPEVMQTMAGLTVVPGSGNASAPQPSLLKGVTGSIGLSGKVTGIVYTAFQDELAKVVAEKILGSEAADQDVNDVVAELTNMITGNLKSQLCDMGYNCALSIPSVVRGDDISVSAKTASVSVRNDFVFDGGLGCLTLQVFATLEK